VALAAKLRLVRPTTETPAPLPAAPVLGAPGEADRLAPRGFSLPERPFRPALLAALLLHLAAAGALLWWAGTGEERAAGGTDDLIVMEGVSVELLDSLPSVLVKAEEVTAAEPMPQVFEEVRAADTEPAAARPVGDVAPVEALPDTASAAPDDAAAAAPDRAPAPDAAPAAMEAAPSEVTTRPVESVTVAKPAPAEPARPAEPKPVDPVAETPVKPAEPVREPEAARAMEDQPARPVDDKPVAVAAADSTAQPKEEPARPAKPPAKAAPSRAAPQSAALKAGRGPTKDVSGAGGSSRDNVGKASASSYRSRLVGHLRRYQSYPAAAASRRLTGTVTVTFTISAGGGVTSARVSRSSGQGILDGAALGMVRRASPFPPIPPGLGSSMTISAPIRFDAR
jgi:protein TonB